MGTQYTNDTKLGDYLIGQATGYYDNFYGGLGVQYSNPSPTIQPIGLMKKDYSHYGIERFPKPIFLGENVAALTKANKVWDGQLGKNSLNTNCDVVIRKRFPCRTKKSLFGKKTEKNKIWNVKIKKYGRRLRQFMEIVYRKTWIFSALL